MATPQTPLHVKPDEEVQLPDEPMDLDDLELNPDLDDTEEPHSPIRVPEVEPEEPLLHENPTLRINVASWTLPFDDAFESLKMAFFGNPRHAAISHEQQSKFVGYVDGEILQIQRKFVKNQSEAAVTYTLYDILGDLVPVLDLIWYSVHENGGLFGQDEYYVRILGDLDDWLAYYSFPNPENQSSAPLYVRLFSLMQSLDTRISFLMDGFPVGDETVKMSSTVAVRLSPIVSRIRMSIIANIDALRKRHLGSEMWNIIDVEVGRLFEGILDRV